MKAKLLITNLNSKEGEFEKILPPEIEILTIGRHPSSYVYLTSAHVSKEHALIIREYDTFYLVDKSTNGTVLNQVRVERDKRNQLKTGDVITIGEYRIVFAIDKDTPVEAVKASIPEPAKVSLAEPAKAAAPAFDPFAQDPFADPNVDPADTLLPYAPTSVQDVINNLEPGEDVSYLVYMGGSKDGQRIELRGSTSEIYIGRAPNCHVQIPHQSIGQMHAKIRLDWAGITVYDLNSQTGVFINGVRINSSRKLHNGDEISFGVPVSMGGVKLILYDRNSISGDNWYGLPPPVDPTKDNKKDNKKDNPTTPEKAATATATATEVAPTATMPANNSVKENEAAAAATANTEPTAEAASPASVTERSDKEKAPAKPILDLSHVVYGDITLREIFIIAVLFLSVVTFIVIAYSFIFA
ncbi:MAG: FHA domain-containing protein [Acidobacteriota bacterium]